MTRTERSGPSNPKPAKNAHTASGRGSLLSRSLTKLLRHQAENEKVPISPGGWIRFDDLLAWKGLDRIGKGITIDEILEAVRDDGIHGKGRFEVKLQSDEDIVEDQTTQDSTTTTTTVSQPWLNPSSKNTPETQATIHHHALHPTTPPTSYTIRAAQGHSIKSVQSTELLTPITLSNPSTIPTTVVHGTFYGAWPLILATGGLKSMGRNNVHFATGPSLDEVLILIGEDSKGMSDKSKVNSVLSQNKVISGMRWDAQLLIYIDLKACLEDVAAQGLDMTWWISGNGVVLTEGVVPFDTTSIPTSTLVTVQDTGSSEIPEDPTIPIIPSKVAKENVQANQSQSSHTTPQQKQRIVPMKYWIAVVEIKNGVGVIWRQGEGVIKELPERLRNMPLPRGKDREHGSGRGGGGGRGRGRGRGGGDGKPRLNVEGDGHDNADA